MKKFLPDYAKIEKIFLTSPINIRDTNLFLQEFKLLIQNIWSIISSQNKKIEIVVLCINEDAKKKTELLLGRELKVTYEIKSVADIWIRDYFSCGSLIDEKTKELSCLKAIYNPSYNSYFPQIDDACGIYLAYKYFENIEYLNLKLDGGNVICNEDYLFISEKLYTENIDLSKKEIDNYFKENFKQKLITLPCEKLDIVGHVDGILRFIDDKTICLPLYNSDFTLDNRYISKIRDKIYKELGLDYKIIYIPSYLSDELNNDNLFSSKGIYINYLRIENNIIFPSFENSQEYEKEINKIFKKAFPEINVVFSPCNSYSFEGGCLNCITNIKYKNS